MAERLSQDPKAKILIIEKRNHIAGNCYDYIDSFTGIRVSKYGAHIFHTNNEKVWNYINQYSKWVPYHHKVYGKLEKEGTKENYEEFPIPINIKTVNILTGQDIKNE